ncbi:MAG: hypothetical protein DDT40_00201 [candidate division WS2 bacterium]|uniref:Nudix hydrolase domain-containing protein n=1 Tax=Psychracetigena formicireducens TaxID=2986056 RepID=A0A9E2F154_PSYF1|nr:hypothetical protein [Candidatus Psychracetigena formicireducens]MBT9145094.1 hypothetical protein [Candidatus Psychracetigena formicireducens]MBT9150035.1 hypothetical protein [Candidatus Psychracetigena formicireducens]
MREKILVVEREAFFEPGFFEGFLLFDKCFKYLSIIENYAYSAERTEVETNINLKQLISYSIINSSEDIFVYQRVSGNEKRLRDLWSIGIGGHIRSRDGGSPLKAVEKGTLREFREELGFLPVNIRLLGLLNLEEREVDRVHLGLVYACEAKPPVRGGEFLPLKEILQLNLENWSKYLLNSLRELKII